MIRVLLTALAIAGLVLGPAASRPGPDSNYNLSVGPPAYVGPGDITSFTAWWGFRAYSAATAGNKAIRVVAADTTQTDINTLANGSLDAATLAAFIVAHGACTITTMYDQVGTNNLTQAGATHQPAITANVVNSSYGATFSQSPNPNDLIATTAFTSTQPFTVSFVAERTSTTSFNTVVSPDNSTSVQLGFSNSANTGLIFAGTVVSVSSVNDNTWHAMNMVLNGASSIYQIDALTGTVNPGTNAMGGTQALRIGDNGVGTNGFTGNFLEAGIILSTALSSGTLASLNSNQHAAYGGF